MRTRAVLLAIVVGLALMIEGVAVAQSGPVTD